MCGIAGFMAAPGKNPDPRALEKMQRVLAHRGPDGEGQWVADDVALAQTRLAIIDLATGDQPIVAPDRQAALGANGEIYNYIELRAGLADVAFRTGSDCEPPLHLYLREGPEFVRHLRGMYALAIHDRAKKRLVLARDPFGIKPLYYAETDAGLAFASEIQALVAGGIVAPRLDPDARDEALELQFGTGRRTLLAGAFRVPPG